MKKSIVMFVILFNFMVPLQFLYSYVIGFGTCLVDYGTEWGTLTSKTAKCAWNHVTWQGINP